MSARATGGPASRQIPLLAPELLRRRMQRDAERSLGRIAAHTVQRQWPLTLPGDSRLARLQGRAEGSDQVVRRVRAGEDGEAAEIEGRHVGGQGRVFGPGDD